MLNSSQIIMSPQDGYGCGKSIVWEYKASLIAKKNGEACPCINIDTLLIKMIPSIIDGKYKAKCKVICPDCDQDYVKTSEKLTEKFIKFYGMNKKHG